jgi:hypothetical protein
MNARGRAAFVVTQDAGPGFVPSAQVVDEFAITQVVDEFAIMSITGTSINTTTTMHRNPPTVRKRSKQPISAPANFLTVVSLCKHYIKY